MEAVYSLLLESDNPAIRFRSKAELLDENIELPDRKKVADYVAGFLPPDWQSAKGLWSTYYLTSIAECGLTRYDFPLNEEHIINNIDDCGCGDFMRLRALVMLGYSEEVSQAIKNLKNHQLPDGGFLCLHRLGKMKHMPKSCVKANNMALLFCAECKKRGVETEIADKLLDYYWQHNIFYKASDLHTLMLNVREGWRSIDVFYPFEVMRIGLQNLVEAFCALGYGKDVRLAEAWKILNSKKDADGFVLLEGTLSKSYLPKERINKPSLWATFYTALAEKEINTDIRMARAIEAIPPYHQHPPYIII